MMSVDPSDDCTFWYTTEYLATTGEFNWHTRIGSFKFPGCGGGTTTNDFSISAAPASLSLNQNATGTATITTAITSGSAQSVALSVSGLPSGATATFSPTSINGAGTSTLTIASGTAAAGSYALTVTGAGASATHTASIALTIAGTPPANDFSISANPSSLNLQQGASGTSTISTAVTSGSAGSVALSVSGAPSGVTATLSSSSVTAGASVTLTVNASTAAAAGSYTITVTGVEGSATHSATVALTIGAVASNDFSISANPSSLNILQGASGTSTISTAVTSGSAQTVSLAVSGAPSGATASISPTSVTAGNGATLTVNAGTAAAGTYTLTVTGSGSSTTHATSVALTVTAASSSGIVNGGFETGDLSGWTASGASETAVSGGHSGSFAARLGSTSPTNGDSSIAQTFTAGSGQNQLAFWYKMTCPDSIIYDWAIATLRDNTAGSTATVLTKTCISNAWSQVTATVTPGHSYTLTLTSHDDNYSADPTYTLFDDVALSSGTVGGGIVNGGFETGSFSGWTRSGTTSITSVSRSGSWAALAGSTSPTSGDSSLVQTFTVPSGKSQLSLYYANNCPDTVSYDWVTVTLRDNTAGTTRTLVPRTCAAVYAWTNVAASVTAGHSYTLTLTSHDDNWSTDPTYTLFDDVTLN
jgi:hypothetical protein